MGIPGMRERAELLGGTLHAAAGPDGGFTITARLPASPAETASPGETANAGQPSDED
jgi:signal transduction histidine kinase